MSLVTRKTIESILRSARIESATHEAKLLFEDFFGDSNSPEPFPVELPEQLLQKINRRVNGEPLQHILGKTSFYGIDIKCDSRALVPRQDTETLVDNCLDLIEKDCDQLIADIGTGSGCILLALLSQRAHVNGIGIDKSGEAISLAQENAILNDFSSRLTLIESDWNDWDGWKDCFLIVSNPPYIASDVIQSLAKDVRDGDPRIALDGGNDGLHCIREIAEIGSKEMRRGSWLVLEIGYDQGESASSILHQNNFVEISVKKDLSGHDRIIVSKHK